MFLLIVTSGLRKGQALGLRCQDCDLAKGTVAVRRPVVTLDGKVAIETPKSAARRTVKLPPVTVLSHREHRTRQLEHHLAVADVWTDRDLAFASELGGPNHPSNVNRALPRLIAKAGVPYLTVHDLRHTHVTWLLAHGQPIKSVSDRLGHAKTSITLDTWAHLIQGMQDGAVEMVRDLLFRRETG